MSEIVRYERHDTVGVITMDDGKANVMSPRMLSAVNAALDLAEADGVVVVLAGRPRMFSAGFDLEVLKRFDDETLGMLRGGFALAARLLAFPAPVVAACTGHGLAMGSFLLCAVDFRVGAQGHFKIGANEVAIGLTMPTPALAILENRLAPIAHTRAIALAEVFTPDGAATVGFLDVVVEAERTLEEAMSIATKLSALDRKAYRGTKALMRAELISAVRAGIETDYPLSR
jgi:enoyl-CoA hydratase